MVAKCLSFFFFFQAEDGIRVWSVTGVQTCALPISGGGRATRAPAPWAPGLRGALRPRRRLEGASRGVARRAPAPHGDARAPRAPRPARRDRRGGLDGRAEERRVGQRGRRGWVARTA